jgi:hypothetical protein
MPLKRHIATGSLLQVFCYTSKEAVARKVSGRSCRRTRPKYGGAYLAKYGGAYLATSISPSLVNFTLCYLISSSVDV